MSDLRGVLISECPYLRGVLISECPDLRGALISECPDLRGALISECPYLRGVLISECPDYRGALISECPDLIIIIITTGAYSILPRAAIALFDSTPCGLTISLINIISQVVLISVGGISLTNTILSFDTSCCNSDMYNFEQPANIKQSSLILSASGINGNPPDSSIILISFSSVSDAIKHFNDVINVLMNAASLSRDRSLRSIYTIVWFEQSGGMWSAIE